MKKNITIAIFILSLLTGVSVFGANVENVSFSYQPGYTVSKIDVKGTIRFTHQTEIAKDGKPFRIIIDILSAEHKLGAKNFNSFPSCAVSQIRSSQYSVKPEKIVRLVYDMKSETMYQIVAEGNQIVIKFPDKKSAKFASWSSRVYLDIKKNSKSTASKTVASKNYEKSSKKTAADAKPTASTTTVASLNQAIESDRQESLQSKRNPTKSSQAKGKMTADQKTSVPSKGKAVASDQKSTKSYASKELLGPDFESSLLKAPKNENKIEIANTKEPAKNSKSVPSMDSQKSSTAAKSTDTKTVASTESKESGKATASKTVASKNSKKSGKASTSKTVVSKNSKKSGKATASKTVASTKSKKSGKASTSKTVASTKSKKSGKATASRFRRTGSRNNKIKGTMVAEFPKRLVIKYKARSRRDPFETLVNEAKVTNSIVNKTRPNVEGLTLVGIIESEDGKNQALFEDKSGFGYILKAGDKVQKGYVLRVRSDRVYFQIFEYGWSRTMALNLEDE